MHQLLDFQLLQRPASVGAGATTTARVSVDFTVDGESLLRCLTRADGGHPDFMGGFVRGVADANSVKLAMLAGSRPPETEEGRYLLYVCPECGDIGCGAYAARVRVGADTVEWHDFAYENGYEPPRQIAEVGPFVFERQQYQQVLERASAV